MQDSVQPVADARPGGVENPVPGAADGLVAGIVKNIAVDEIVEVPLDGFPGALGRLEGAQAETKARNNQEHGKKRELHGQPFNRCLDRGGQGWRRTL